MLSCSDDVTVFTDHRNLLFTFHPTAVESNFGRQKVLKVIRWSLYLSSFPYRIEHVPGELNILADIMTRWLRGYRQTKACRMARTCAVLESTMVPTSPRDPAQWPSRASIIDAQNRGIAKKKPSKGSSDEDGLVRIDDMIWIPEEADSLKIKLLMVAHAVVAGHQGYEATAATLREEFKWNGPMKRATGICSKLPAMYAFT